VVPLSAELVVGHHDHRVPLAGAVLDGRQQGHHVVASRRLAGVPGCSSSAPSGFTKLTDRSPQRVFDALTVATNSFSSRGCVVRLTVPGAKEAK
jgi:hypothetical protein